MKHQPSTNITDVKAMNNNFTEIIHDNDDYMTADCSHRSDGCRDRHRLNSDPCHCVGQVVVHVHQVHLAVYSQIKLFLTELSDTYEHKIGDSTSVICVAKTTNTTCTIPFANIGRMSGDPHDQVNLLSLKTESNSTGFSFQPQTCHKIIKP